MRNKKLPVIILMVLVILCTYLPVRADSPANIKVSANNSPVAFSIPPADSDGTAMVPAKELLESLGGTFYYDEATMTGSARLGSNELAFSLDSSIASFDGKYVDSGAPMRIINNRFMIPAIFTADKLGVSHYMDTARNTLMLFNPTDSKLSYKVLPGDTLYLISKTFGTTITTIKQQNSLISDMIYVGQMLFIRNLTPGATAIAAQITGGATLRSGPGFSADVVGYLAPGASITITGKNGDWYKVNTSKGSGYLYYTVVGITQELTAGAKSTYFSSNIPVDTSKDSIAYNDYLVARGDSIWSVSQKFGITDTELASANSMTATTTLYPGQTLKIPVHSIAVKSTAGAQYGEVLDWFAEGRYVFPIGKTGKVTDMATGKSFMVKRTMGASHSDTETLTAGDTAAMKEIFGGSWSWKVRPFILETDGRRLAVSISGMPHAGVDGVPYLQNVDNRSGNYGYGPNDDTISGNGMDGHFDLYFLNGLRHVDNKLDPQHQFAVLTAGGLQ